MPRDFYFMSWMIVSRLIRIKKRKSTALPAVGKAVMFEEVV